MCAFFFQFRKHALHTCRLRHKYFSLSYNINTRRVCCCNIIWYVLGTVFTLHLPILVIDECRQRFHWRMRDSLFASVQTIQPMLDWTHEYRLPDAHLQTYPDTKPGIKYFHRIFFGFVIICYVLIKFQSRSIWLNILVYLLNVIECYVSLYTREIVIRDDNSVFVIVSDNPCTSRMPTTISKKSTQIKKNVWINKTRFVALYFWYFFGYS